MQLHWCIFFWAILAFLCFSPVLGMLYVSTFQSHFFRMRFQYNGVVDTLTHTHSLNLNSFMRSLFSFAVFSYFSECVFFLSFSFQHFYFWRWWKGVKREWLHIVLSFNVIFKKNIREMRKWVYLPGQGPGVASATLMDSNTCSIFDNDILCVSSCFF